MRDVWMLLAAFALVLSGRAAVPPASPVGLETLPPESASQGWGQLGVDRAVGGTPLSIGGRAFAHGLGTHANSEIVYELGGAFTNFSAWVGVDDNLKNHPESPKASVVFQVFADGAKLFDSGVMRMGDAAKEVSVPLADVEVLKLVVADAGDGISCDHADWAEPVLGLPDEALAKPGGRTNKVCHEVKAGGLTLRFDADGAIVGAEPLGFAGRTRLAGCRSTGATTVARLPDGGIAFTRPLADAQGRAALVTDRFTPTSNSVRWEIEIASTNAPWSTAIETRLDYPTSDASRLWTTWGHPDNHPSEWVDPLETRPFASRSWVYQFPDYRQMGTTAKRAICIPLVTALEPARDAAISLAQSPEDVLLDLDLRVTKAGGIRLSRSKYRLGQNRAVHFAMDLVAHPADPRAGLGWYVARYPALFHPGNPRAQELSGSAAYSGDERPINARFFEQIGFAYNWKLSDDFPYMGHFLPPVKDADERWRRSCAEGAPPGKGAETSCRQLDDYARWMRTNGFHVLSYFNVTEYGKNMPWPLEPRLGREDARYWTDPVAYLVHRGIDGAVMMEGKAPMRSNCYGALIVDPGHPGYMDHLVEQVKRNVALLPNTDGIGIDRLDWLGHYNPAGDDGVSWVNDAPARSLFISWQRLCDRIVPELHRAGKVLFLNNCSPRIEVIGRGDGIFAEWASDAWQFPSYINYAALAGLAKPTALWTCPGETSDFYMQRLLYLGVNPIAPYPSNNHCIGPTAEGRRLVDMYAGASGAAPAPVPADARSPEAQQLAYGPLLKAMRGKTWVLEPHCVETDTPGAKVNLFVVPGGYALPVAFGGTNTMSVVRLRGLPALSGLRAEALHPGMETPAAVSAAMAGEVLALQVPLVRGCAMVRLAGKGTKP